MGVVESRAVETARHLYRGDAGEVEVHTRTTCLCNT